MVHVSHAMVFKPEEADEDAFVDILIGPKSDKSDVKVNPELTEEQRGEVMKVLEEFQDVFTDVSGLTNLGKHPITLTTEEPINSKLYLLPYAMHREGTREPSRSPDAVFVVIIRKPDELNKVCIDFSKLDKVTMFDPKLISQKVLDPFWGQVINQFN